MKTPPKVEPMKAPGPPPVEKVEKPADGVVSVDRGKIDPDTGVATV